MSEQPIVAIKEVYKRFKKIQALSDINLDVPSGRIVGLLGTNGAGKSTLLRHLIGLYLPDSGTCEVFGTESAKLEPKDLARIGYVHQEGELIGWMTVSQLLRYVSSYYPKWNMELEKRYIEEFDVETDAKVSNLSPGQRQKLAVLIAIGFEPELLILDEPAAAMDPIARRRFLNLLLEIIQDQNKTIIISSHILTDVEKIIDHVLIMDKGKILRDTGFDELLEEFCRIKIISLNGSLSEDLPFKDVFKFERSTNGAIVTMRSIPKSELETISQKLNSKIEFLPLTLEDIYSLVLEK